MRPDLNVKQIDKLAKTGGCHWVADRLYLQVIGGSQTWITKPVCPVCRVLNGTRAGKGVVHAIGLGPRSRVSLREAKDAAYEIRRAVDAGDCPRKANRHPKPKVHAFREAAEGWIEVKRPSWSPKYAEDVPKRLSNYAAKLNERNVASLDVDDVLSVLRPIWHDHTKLATQLRGDLEGIFSYAIARGWRTNANPARWAEALSVLLPDPDLIAQETPKPSLHWSELPDFLVVLRAQEGSRFRALELLIQTGLRSAELIGACWCEFDFDAALWRVPAVRMKGGLRQKRCGAGFAVPLAPSVIEFVRSLPRTEGDDRLFPDLYDGALLKALNKCFEIAGRVWKDKHTGKKATVHGFRATLATWATDNGFDPALADMALAHVQGSAVSRRYQRGDLAALRADLMAAWATYCAA